MAGGKLRAAKDNMKSIFEAHIGDSDEVMLVHFNNKIYLDFPFTKKKGNEALITEKIALLEAGGGTAFFDAMDMGIDECTKQGHNGNYFIVCLTDGSDNHSKKKCSQVVARLQEEKSADLVCVVIGVGDDVVTAELQAIAAANTKGLYVAASGDARGISDAFSKVAVIIKGQLLLEEF
jgi:uncharacterized protein with von Willebrand factor type A (vWA) domain